MTHLMASIMIRIHLRYLVFLIAVLSIAPVLEAQVLGPKGAAPKGAEFRLMTWNILHGGRDDGKEVGPQRVVDVIRRSQANIVAMQETYGSGERIAEQLGFHFHPRGTNVSILSRYPIAEDLSVFEEFKCVGALIELPAGQRVAVYSIWLPYNAEIWEAGARDPDDTDSMRKACQASCEDLRKIKDQIQERLAAPKYENVPIIVAGDFNSMSHLDYLPCYRDQFDGVALDWPTSHVLIDEGYRDAWRETHPEVDRAADRTWTPRFPDQQQDRIDFIYYRGPGLQVIESERLDTHPEKFPSDHAAVVGRFRIQRHNEGDTLTNLRVASYNIKHGQGTDGRVDLRRTAAVLRNLHADVIALQEVDRNVRRSGQIDQPEFFSERLGTESAFGKFMDYQGGAYGLAILSRYPILESKEIQLPEGNEPRVALACKVQLPAGEVMFVNVHFDWVGDDRFRYAQAEKLSKYLSQLKRPYILMGDFNDQPGSRTLRLLSRGAVEADKPADNRFTFSSTDPRREIDFIFVAPATAWRIGRCRVLDAPLTSDHRPVISSVELVDPSNRQQD